MAETFGGVFRPDYLRDAAASLTNLRALVAGQIAALEPAEAWLREQVEDPEEAEAEARASLLQEPVAARLFLRYHAEARTAFQRAYGTLLKTLEFDAAHGAEPSAAGSEGSQPAPAGAAEAVSVE